MDVPVRGRRERVEPGIARPTALAGAAANNAAGRERPPPRRSTRQRGVSRPRSSERCGFAPGSARLTPAPRLCRRRLPPPIRPPRRVTFTCVDGAGVRRQVRALPGDSLAEALARAGVVEPGRPGRGAAAVTARPSETVAGGLDVHVVLSDAWASRLPAATEEERALLRRLVRGPEDLRTTSRAGASVKVAAADEGGLCAVGAVSAPEFVHL